MSLTITLAVLVFSMFLFIQGRIRSDIVALVSLILLLVMGVIDSREALEGFSNPIILMMLGLFVVGGGVFRTGLARVAGQKILKIAGNNENVLFAVIMIVTAIFGAFVSNTGTAALMLPIAMSVASRTKSGPKRFLIPMAFACSIGGMLTLIGTPPNMVINDALIKAGYPSLKLFSFTPIGFVVFGIVLLSLLPVSKILSRRSSLEKENFRRGKSLSELADEYQLSRNVIRVKILDGSPLIGKKLAELQIPSKYNLSVIELRRDRRSKVFFKEDRQEMPGPQSEAFAGGVLHLLGDADNVKKFAEENKAAILENGEGEDSDALQFRQIGIAEILLMPDSSLIGHSVLDTNFRAQYGVNLLGIQRKGEYILRNLKDVSLNPRDILLVQGTWEKIRKLSESNTDWIVLGQPLEEAEKVPLDHKMPVAAAILLLMVALMVTNLVPPVAAVLLAALLMVLCGCFRSVEDAYKTIDWESVVLIAAMLPMSTALEKTGVSGIIAKSLVANLGQFGPYALLAGIYFTTSIVTIFISNTATAVLLAPIGMSAALGLGVSPYPFLFAVSISASCCFISPFSTPPNALVMNAGRYVFMDYLKIGGPLQLCMGIIMTFVLPLFFPFHP